jgi:putative transcriptional regulator
MSEAFESIKQGLNEAIEFAKNNKQGATIHKFDAVDVKAILTNIELSQTQFAKAFGISVSTLRHWERGDRKPNGPALALLNIVTKEPKMALKALNFN